MKTEKPKNDLQILQSFAKEFGTIVKKARRSMSMTQEQLAKMINTNRTTIIKIEQGLATYMPASRALEICEVLNQNLTEIWVKMNLKKGGSN